MPELTVSYCLEQIAKNIKQYNSYIMRIGISLLSMDVSTEAEHIMPNSYTVYAWDGEEKHFSDLFDAILWFIKINKDEWNRCRKECEQE